MSLWIPAHVPAHAFSRPGHSVSSEPFAVALDDLFVCQVAEMAPERGPMARLPAFSLAELAIGALEMQMRDVLTDDMRAFDLDKLY